MLFGTAMTGSWPETLKRYLYKVQGGGGEGAYWGEPMSYALFMVGVPSTLAGALLGAGIAVQLAGAASRAGGWWPLVQRHFVAVAVAWTMVVGLTAVFVYVQWRRAREDVDRYRAATRSPAVVITPPQPAGIDGLRNACAGGDGWSCFTAGVRYERADGVARDFAQAAAFYEKACDVPYGMGCVYLGDSYLHGEGVARDDARAASLYRRGAELLEQDCGSGGAYAAYACYALGTMYRTGQGVGVDAVRANRLFDQGCQAGDKTACAAFTPPSPARPRPPP